MTTVKEISITSVGEPYYVSIERGQKGGYGFEIRVHGETIETCIEDVLSMKKKIEEELYGGGKDAQQTA